MVLLNTEKIVKKNIFLMLKVCAKKRQETCGWRNNMDTTVSQYNLNTAAELSKADTCTEINK